MYILRDILGYLVMILPCITASSRYQKAICIYHDLEVIQEEKLDDNIAQMMRRYLVTSFLGILIVFGLPDGLVIAVPFAFIEAVVTVFWSMFIDDGYFERPTFEDFLDNAYMTQFRKCVHQSIINGDEVKIPDYEAFRDAYHEKSLILEHVVDYWKIDEVSRRRFILRITVPRIIFCAFITILLHYIRVNQLS